MAMILAVILATLLLYAIPGVLLHTLLGEQGYGRIQSLGLGLALLTVLYSGIASLMGYHLWLQLALTLALDAGLLGAIIRRGQLAQLRAWWPRLAAWQWLFIATIVLGYLGPALVIPVPFDTDAQGFGLLIATVRQSGSITTLAPWQPDVGWFYSPGYFLLAAPLADLTGAEIHQVMLGFSHLLGLGLVAAIASLAGQWWGNDYRWYGALAAAIPNGLFTTLMDSAYTNIYGIWLTAVFLGCLTIALRTTRRRDILLAGVTLGSVLLGHPDSIIHLLLVYIPFYFTSWLARPRWTRQQYLHLAVIIPLLGILTALPWIVRVLPLVAQIGVHERQNPNPGHLWGGMMLNGYLIPLLALVGIFWAVRRRDWQSVWLLTWLIPIIEISSWGNLDKLSRQTAIDPMQVFYPLGVIWHATIIPLPLLASHPLAALGGWLRQKLPARQLIGLTTSMLTLAILAGTGALWQAEAIITALRPTIYITGAVAAPADLDVYHWLRENTAIDARLLNYPGNYEGQWVPVIAERDSIYIRDQLFYLRAEELRQNWIDLETAYLDPANHEETIRAYEIDYVIVPHSLRYPQGNLWRWRPPPLKAHLSDWADVDYVELAYKVEGAEVWRVLPP